MSLPPFANGIRIVPYYSGSAKRAYRVDIGKPFNGFDVAYDDDGDDMARIAARLKR